MVANGSKWDQLSSFANSTLTTFHKSTRSTCEKLIGPPFSFIHPSGSNLSSQETLECYDHDADMKLALELSSSVYELQQISRTSASIISSASSFMATSQEDIQFEVVLENIGDGVGSFQLMIHNCCVNTSGEASCFKPDFEINSTMIEPGQISAIRTLASFDDAVTSSGGCECKLVSDDGFQTAVYIPLPLRSLPQAAAPTQDVVEGINDVEELQLAELVIAHVTFNAAFRDVSTSLNNSLDSLAGVSTR